MKKILLLVLALSLVVVFASGCQPADEGTEPREFTGFDSLEEAAVSEAWQDYFPNQYATYLETAEMVRTTYGGSGEDGEKMDYLEMYPFLKSTYAGFPFSVSYYRSRGHVYSLTDTLETGRLPDLETRPATCLSCKSTDVVVLQDKYGDEWYSRSFAEVVGDNAIGCLDCHDANDASVTYQRDYLTKALEQNTFRNINPEGRADLTCAQCHVNYHFNPETREPVLPWSIGLTVEDQFEHYNQGPRYNDEWEHEITGALVAKVQHPEYELYHEGQIQSVHSAIGMGCTDCHMPAVTDADGNEFTSHRWTTPLEHIEDSCLTCHSDWGAEGIIERTEGVQSGVYEQQNRVGYELEEFILAVGEARENDTVSAEELERLQAIHREAQFYWDFIWVENSNGFHNWEEAHRVLGNVEELLEEAWSILE
ncbi:ammonia-forming cytochrome c nitrite reductase subunit c552 [Dethiobacter alkaliphilus]|uniref:nitrite reductase (cytochrome; ammonia-forming) n=1 Tax=Dethiobacter alkaliphilus AHT 1 TaxID=555088 RepID=C0GEH5_DETAL|nr:ammonia-forming cytochrome c nitrite reductase subunit c552 [Dethiobacter alkaliphilus]EEG78469.1 Nitrite reductase (cytochrome; ammonia-forming) [Dethiobacter alkaliphilus AHT 1]